jgi:hypothetical protein
MRNLSTVKTEEHARALKERDRFLSDHPELGKLQGDIDRKLGKASTEHNRLVIIHNLMMDAFKEMDQRLQEMVGTHRSTSQER